MNDESLPDSVEQAAADSDAAVPALADGVARDPAEQPVAPVGTSELEAVERLKDGYDRIRRELSRVIVGQDEVIDQLLVAMLSRGHVILEGVPGLAKTLMISTAARCLDL
ncbi:MAG: hypothetical protein V3W34_00980, partial [Phycisphaerae bacterium]